MQNARKNVKGNVKKPFDFAFCIQYVFRLCFVSIVYSYLLNCIVPLMSMKFPVKHTEDESFYLSAKIFFFFFLRGGGETSVANRFVQLFASDLVSQDGVPLLCYWGLYCFGALLFQIKIQKIVLKEYTSNPRMCVCVADLFHVFDDSKWHPCLFLKNVFLPPA